MAYLIAVLASFGLLLAFVLLVTFERRKGVRALPRIRASLDRDVDRLAFVASHIDWGGFAAHIAKTNAEKLAHDIIHAILLGVRTIERVLTRLIRNLRERLARHDPEQEPIEGSQLVATLVKFRKNRKPPRDEQTEP